MSSSAISSGRSKIDSSSTSLLLFTANPRCEQYYYAFNLQEAKGRQFEYFQVVLGLD